MLSILPSELLTYIFCELPLDKLFECRRVCTIFNQIIKSYPWSHHKIIIQQENLDKMHWFLLNFNFQWFKIKDPDISLNDNIWYLLLNRSNVKALATHITSVLDDSGFELEKKNASDFYLTFNKCIKIPYNPFICVHLTKLHSKVNGSLHKILQYSLSELHSSHKNLIELPKDTELHIVRTLHAHGVCPQEIIKIRNVETLNYFMTDWLKNRISIGRGSLTLHTLLSFLQSILLEIDKIFLVEAFQKKINDPKWIDELIHVITEYVAGDKVILVDTLEWRVVPVFGFDKSTEMYHMRKEIIKQIQTIHKYNWRSRIDIKTVIPEMIKEFTPYVRNMAKWNCIKKFSKYHPDYLTELVNYGTTSLFVLGDALIMEVLQKKKYRNILEILKSNTNFTKPQNQITLTEMVSVPNHRFTTKVMMQQFQHLLENAQPVHEWLLRCGFIDEFQYLCNMSPKYFTPVKLFPILLEGNIDIAQFVLNQKICRIFPEINEEYNSSIDMLLARSSVITFEFMYQNALLPKIFQIDLQSNVHKIIWTIKHSTELTFVQANSFFACYGPLGVKNINIKLNDLDFSSKLMSSLVKWIRLKCFSLPNGVLLTLFYKAIHHRNLNLLNMLHQYYSKRLHESARHDKIIYCFTKKSFCMYESAHIIEWLWRKKYLPQTSASYLETNNIISVTTSLITYFQSQINRYIDAKREYIFLYPFYIQDAMRSIPFECII